MRGHSAFVKMGVKPPIGTAVVAGNSRRGFASCAVLLSLVLLSGCASLPSLPNFHTVVGGSIYRGAEPTPEGWMNLWSLGVRYVVKLNTKEEGTDDIARALGMIVCEVPITTQEQIVGLIDPEKLELAVLAIVPGTFVHCGSVKRTASEINALVGNVGGQDRTGLICAMYRVQVQGWTKEKARKEMLRLGFHQILHGLNEAFENFKPAP